jgi:transcriptional regulator with GAF, ATPase, and Fis domain
VFPIVAPPLRKRKEDNPELAAHFITNAGRRMGLSEVQLKEKHVKVLCAYVWLGNIRELQHVIERRLILGRGQALMIDLPEGTRSAEERRASLSDDRRLPAEMKEKSHNRRATPTGGSELSRCPRKDRRQNL